MLRDVRAGGNRLPVVILSARDDTDVKVTGSSAAPTTT